ncbi:hypothetical protein yc1106_04721 [Curvularia clavata]|uniref:Major facilitator superfamily (MFS) profile domain-containing protein n=1 Tax=Curvularia clavata TaxID=95742 RepID=A0A9Q8Z8C8_CURCL|nr:hypothetical protein yc1106_04721 [Curvularia clavata]
MATSLNNEKAINDVESSSMAPRVSTKNDVQQINLDAARATEVEHNMSLWQGLKLYPNAVAWSVLLSAAIIMEGFDIVLIANLFAVPAFKKQFGVKLPNGDYELTSSWQAGLTNGAVVGELLGLTINGWIADRFGYKKTMIGALLGVNFLIFILFFAESVEQLLAGLILVGIPWGIFQTLTTTYAAEVCPVALRAYLTTYVNLCWVMGQFLASAVLKGVSTREDEWAYRIPYALQWIWPIPLIVGITFAPESPWWLVRKGRIEDAKKVLLRLTSKHQIESFNADETVSMMVHTNEMEKSSTESTGYMDCFKNTDLRRTEICAMVWFIQSWCGSSFMGYSTYFYENAGLDTSNAFTMSLVQYSLGAIGVFCSWALISRFGRRTLYLGGLILLFVLLMIIGFLGLINKTNKGAQWAIGSMLLAYTFIYDASVGPVCYSLVSEIPSSRLRQKTVVIARNVYNLGGIVNNVLTPNMLNPSAWNWGAKSGFFWAGACFTCILWCYFRLPEPKNRTYGEIDILFKHKVSARKFASTPVDTFTASIGTDEGMEKVAVEHIEKA